MPARLILQRLLPNSDGWRSVVKFDATDSQEVQGFAAGLSRLADVAWRIVVDDRRQQVLAIHDGRAWQAVAEAEPAPATLSAPMPWWQPAAALAKLRRAGGFPDTVPFQGPADPK